MIGAVRVSKIADLASVSPKNWLISRQAQLFNNRSHNVVNGCYASVIPHSTFLTYTRTSNREDKTKHSRVRSIGDYNIQPRYHMDSYQTPRRYSDYPRGGYSDHQHRGYGTSYDTFNHSRPPRPYNRARGREFITRLPTIRWETMDLVEIKKDFYDLSYEADSRPGEEIEAILKQYNIIIEGEVPLPKPVISFDEAVFNEPIQRLIKRAEFSEPTPIQKVGWTSCLTGRDVVGVSQTGSGKTLTFLLPGLLHLLAQPPVGTGGPIVLILAPTRELCLQISAEAAPYLKELKLKGVAAYGGSSRFEQRNLIAEGVDVIVATPGRLLDLLSEGSVRLDRVSYLVLDEADRMFDMGFEPQVRGILSQIRPDRQILLFSATWPQSIRTLASEFCGSDLIYIQVGDLELTANPNIRQRIYPVYGHEVMPSLYSFLENEGFGKKILIFSDTRRFAQTLAFELKNRGYSASALHGELTQGGRERVMSEFRRSKSAILVATDVASRGIDIKDIDYVINLDAPRTIEDYIHRIGRTARGNNTGDAILYFPVDMMSPIKSRFAKSLVSLLDKLGQDVPQEFRSIAERY